MKIDIDFIKKYVDISEEELMMRLVKDAVALQQEAEANKKEAERKERLENPEYPKLVLQFWNQVPYLRQYFTDDEIVNAAAHYMSKSGLTHEIYIRGHREELPYGLFLRHARHKFNESRGSWTRETMDDASVFLVASQYQGVSGGHEAVKKLLIDKLPYLEIYNPTVYDIDSRNDWIYIPFKTEENGEVTSCSLYCPVSALMKGDVDAIVSCHLNYWKDYGRGKYDAREEEFIKSKPVQEFLKDVKAGAPVIEA